MGAWDVIKSFYKRRALPCPCGGVYRHRLGWAEGYYFCSRCGRSLDEERFKALYADRDGRRG